MAEEVSATVYWLMAICTVLVCIVFYCTTMLLTAYYWKPEAVFFAASLGGCLIGIYLGWKLNNEFRD